MYPKRKNSIRSTIRYPIVNVFTENAFEGNPLAAMKDASFLSSTEIQLIARQINLSETSFVLPSAHAVACIRIFTPYEVPFAGHSVLVSWQHHPS